MSKRRKEFYENWKRKLERLQREHPNQKEKLSQKRGDEFFEKWKKRVERLKREHAPRNNKPPESLNSNDSCESQVQSTTEAVEEDELDYSLLAKETEDSAMAICNMLERLEEIEKTLTNIQESLEDEEKKRETLGCAVIICGGILFSLILCEMQAFGLAGVVFLGTIIGASLYATR